MLSLRLQATLHKKNGQVENSETSETSEILEIFSGFFSSDFSILA